MAEIFLGGYFGNSVNFGGTTLTNNGGVDSFFSKIDENGNTIWITQFDSTSTVIGHDIKPFSDGSSITVGEFSGTANFGSSSLTISGNEDAFIVKLDSNGNVTWRKNFGGSAACRAYSATALADGS